MNESARRQFLEVRRVLEEWFARYPATDQADLRSRFRSSDDYAHLAAFFELYLHEVLVRCGFVAIPHPDVPGTTHRPDFLASDSSGRRLFYLEATTIQPSNRARGAEARANQALGVLERLDSPDYSIALRVRGAPATPPPASRIRNDLDRWLASLSKDDMERRYAGGGIGDLPVLPFQHEGWDLEFRPIPRGTRHPGSQGRLIGLLTPGARVSTLSESILTALREKGGHYGNPDLPLVVGLNVPELCFVRDELLAAIFGKPVWELSLAEDGSVVDQDAYRSGPAYWARNCEVAGRRISAVLAVSHLNATNILERIPVLWHHPSPSHPLPEELLPFPSVSFDLEGGSQRSSQGAPLDAFFGLGPPWPPPDA